MDRRARSGFALPAVLAVTGVVTLIFLVAITALASLNAEAASARDRVRFLQRAMTAEATLAYVAATEPVSQEGFAIGGPRRLDLLQTLQGDPPPSIGPVSTLHLDGRPYRMDVGEPAVVSLQDQAGQINMAILDAEQWRRLGEAIGLRPDQARGLWTRYIDYIDSDDFSRLNGGERREYGGRGPANRMMREPAEVLALLDVREQIDPARWRAIRRDLAADPMARTMNINTATPAMLEVMFGLTPAQAANVIRVRQEAPLQSIGDVFAASGVSVFDDGERIYTFPSGRVVFEIRDTRSPWIYRGRIAMTPNGLEQPIWIDQTEMTEAPGRARADISNAAELPYATD